MRHLEDNLKAAPSSPALWAIHILRQQKDRVGGWVGGSRKWPVLLTFGTVFMADKVGGVQKAQKYADVI